MILKNTVTLFCIELVLWENDRKVVKCFSPVHKSTAKCTICGQKVSHSRNMSKHVKPAHPESDSEKKQEAKHIQVQPSTVISC